LLGRGETAESCSYNHDQGRSCIEGHAVVNNGQLKYENIDWLSSR
jgi:hypothetical protein